MMNLRSFRALAPTLLVVTAACSLNVRITGEPIDSSQEHLVSTEQIHAALSAHPEWIRDAILTNPQMVIDAQMAVAQKQAVARQAVARQSVAENRAAVFADPADPVIGNSAGDVTIVEMTDYQCPYCKGITPVLDQLLASDPGIRLVTKEFPILGPGSEIAARYALASMKQGKYAPFHAALMADKTPEHQLDEARIRAIAGQLGLDLARLKFDAESQEISARITANRLLAQKLAITGTPGLIVGDQVQSGAMTLEALKKAVAEARARQQGVRPQS